jgi:katanin p60 ATPase-containing subunit A1
LSSDSLCHFPCFCREIDQAFLRRFERKLLIDVPSFNERKNLIKHFLPCAQYWREDDLDELALSTENFTGDDIRVAVKEANMMIIRKKIRNKAGETVSTASELDVEFHHLKDSLKQIKPNSESDIVKQRQWNSSCGKS